MTTQHDFAELQTLYEAQLQVIGEQERRIAAQDQIIEGLAAIAPACQSKTRLLKKHAALARPKVQEPTRGH